VVDESMFTAISEYVYEKLKQESEEILSGNVQIAPYKCRKNTGCNYCSYASVCGFDKKSGSKYRMLEPLSEDEVCRKIMRRNEETEGGGNDGRD